MRAVKFRTWNAVVGWTVFAALQVLWMLLADAWTQSLHLAGLGLTLVAVLSDCQYLARCAVAL